MEKAILLLVSHHTTFTNNLSHLSVITEASVLDVSQMRPKHKKNLNKVRNGASGDKSY